MSEISNEGFQTVVNDRILRKKAITSYSIVVHTLIKGEIHFLLGKVRDSIAFKEYLKADQRSEDLSWYATQMTIEEKQRCIFQNIRQIISEVFTNHESNSYILAYNNIYKWNAQKSLDYPILSEKGISEIWVIPKGRMNTMEEPLDAALREFEEEVGISRELLMTYDHEPIEETYTGLDNKIYRTVYFLGYLDNYKLTSSLTPKLVTSMRMSLNSEIQKVDWFTYDEAKKIVDGPKAWILRNFHSYLLFNLPNFLIDRPKTA